MRTAGLFKITLLCITALTLNACAPYALRPSTITAIDSLLGDYSAPKSPGASILVISNGEVVFEKSYGLAELEHSVEATPRTNYRLASVTKQFTATAVLQLVQRGKLSLDSRLTDVLPGAPAYAKDVRIRHLLTHTSGLVDYEDLIPESQTVQVLDRDALKLLASIDSVYFPPGAKYKYSNSGYALLALVVEAVSGERFADYLKKNIFDPLGMSHTIAFENGISTVDDRSYGYSRTDTGFVQTDQSVTSAVLGDGGIYSSVRDLARWDEELYRNGLISPELRRLSFTPNALNDGTKTTYGFGWNVEPYKNEFCVYHTGSTRGFRNAILRLPDRRLTLIILTNRNEGEPVEIARKIADLVIAKTKSH